MTSCASIMLSGATASGTAGPFSTLGPALRLTHVTTSDATMTVCANDGQCGTIAFAPIVDCSP